eukprot:1880431-Prymnesium_polylepis.1
MPYLGQRSISPQSGQPHITVPPPPSIHRPVVALADPSARLRGAARSVSREHNHKRSKKPGELRLRLIWDL